MTHEESPAARGDSIVYGLAVLAGAVLVFQIQPIAGKLLLPVFGGGASVWTACMFYFQSMLLAGYGYAHLLTSVLRPPQQVIVHSGLLVLSALFLPVSIAVDGAAAGGGHPGVVILLVLVATTGFPFLILASTAPLIQRWLSMTRPGRSPWHLYALSNAGALLALLTYPLLIEPRMTLQSQTLVWSTGYAAFLLMSLAACRFLWSHRHRAEAELRAEAATVGGERNTAAPAALATVVLSACGVVMLLAVTSQITQNVAPVPFLWVLPLVVFLLSYIITFSGERWYDRSIWGSLFVVAISSLIILEFFGTAFPIRPVVIAYLLVLFCICMICHGELYRLRPAPRGLSVYYLLIALGGATGGAVVSVLAPAVFVRYWEALATAYVIYLMLGLLVLRDYRTKLKTMTGSRLPALQVAVERWSHRLFLLGWVTGIFLLPAIVVLLNTLRPEYDVASVRNFYGILNVRDMTEIQPPRRVLIDGTTIHGFQLLEETMSAQPTSYYGPNSGIALVMEAMERPDTGLRIGVVGLGTGTLAAYGQARDVFRFYELNPAVADLANTHFTFLRDSAAAVEIVLGDGRLSMERELRLSGSRNYDVLVIDAFNSDAIPVHLLTHEALQTYWSHLRSGGVLAFHVTNSYLDLAPVVANLGAAFGKKALHVETVVDTGVISRADWVLLVEQDSAFVGRAMNAAIPAPAIPPPATRVWTDDYSDLLGTLK